MNGADMTNKDELGKWIWANQITSPAQEDVDALRELLDLMVNFPSNDQRARYLLSSNWLRDYRPSSEITPKGT